MVAKLVKVIFVISAYLLCNCISSVHSGPILEVNNQAVKQLNITTLSSIGDETTKVIEPIDPALPTVNPTISPITFPSSSSTSSTTIAPSTTTNSSTTNTTGISTSTLSPTAAPLPPVTPPSTPSPSGSKDRHFDGPSFIGGIVLAAGLACIGFVGFKVYRARTERNYHTL